MALKHWDHCWVLTWLNSPWKIVQKIDHRWRSPLVQKEELLRPVIEGWVGKTFHSPLLYFLVPSAPSFLGPQPPTAPTPVPAPINSDVDLMIFDWSCHFSLFVNLFSTPNKGSQNLCVVFICQEGHLGIGIVHGFWALMGWWKEHRLSGGGFAKGFCTGDLGRTVYFRVVAIGSQQSFYIKFGSNEWRPWWNSTLLSQGIDVLLKNIGSITQRVWSFL